MLRFKRISVRENRFRKFWCKITIYFLNIQVIMKKNQLNRFRKCIQKSFNSFCEHAQFVFFQANMKACRNLELSFKEYCKKMLYLTLGNVFFNIIILLLNLFLCRTL